MPDSNVPLLPPGGSGSAPAVPPAGTPGQWPGAPCSSPAVWYGVDSDLVEPATPLSHYLWILRRRLWKILSFVVASVLAAWIVSSRITPVYESVASIDIDRRVPAGVLGQDSMQSAVHDADQFLATQIKLIQSDSVLRPVVHRFNLFPGKDAPASVRFTEAADAPVKLRGLKVSRPPNTYLLLVSYRSPDPRLAADVANAIANSYIEHTYNIRYRSTIGLSSFMEKQLEELKANMERSSAALLQFERELNVINPEEKTGILSSRLLQLNTEYTNAQAERVRREAAYNSVRGGSLEAAQVSSQGESLRRIADRLQEASEKFAQVKAHYGANHPEYRRAAAQVAQLQSQLDESMRSILRRVEIEYREALSREAMLKQAVAETKAEFDRLNARSFQYQALKREAEADKKLYEELVRRIKEAGINAGFQNSAIRLADPARPALEPVYPNLGLNLALAFLFSSILAVGAAILADALDNTVRDPEQVRRVMNTEVLGSLPLVKDWRRRGRLPSPASAPVSLVPARASSPEAPASPAADSFAEAIRTLRNSILLGSFNRPLKSILVTSAAPGEGKTTTAVHLALAHARQKYRTLLVDADLRRPSVHRLLGIPAGPGLAAVLSDGLDWRGRLVKLDGLPDLDVLPAGLAVRGAAELLGRSLPAILGEAASGYDLVVLDSPPVLGFPEPLQMAAAVDGVVLVALAGKTDRKAVASAVATLQRLRANVMGVVLNEVTRSLGDGYYGYYGYYDGKYYRHYNNPSS